MLLYPREHYQSVEPVEEPDEPARAYPAAGLVNLVLALCGIVLYLDDVPRGAFLVLIVLALLNAVTVIRRQG